LHTIKSELGFGIKMDKLVFEKLFNLYQPKERWIEQVIHEFCWMVEKAESTTPHCILEIGVKYGGSLKFWERLVLPNDLVIGVDNNPDTLNYRRWKWENSNREIHVIIGDSRDAETVEKVKKILDGRKVDFLFIDGGHGIHEGPIGGRQVCVDSIPAKDFKNYSPFVRSGGIVLVADLGEPCPMKLWNSLEGKKEKCGAPMLGHGAWWKP